MWTLWITAHATPTLDQAVDASGTHGVVVDVPAFGRYAFEVRSPSGIAVQLVDRDAGPGETAGIAGERDGRLDAFLDVGEVLLRTTGAPNASGQARVLVTASVRVGADLLLPPRQPVLTELSDHQERRWWVDLPDAAPLAVEATGRHLADLRVWRDGTWLVGAQTQCAGVEPEEGRPQTRCVLTAQLEPGLYAVVAYGGASRPWANDVADTQLTVLRDVPVLPEAGRRVGRIGATGVERFRVPKEVDTAHLSLPDIAHASVQLHPWSEANPFDGSGRIAHIDDTSRSPEATVRHGGGGRPQVLVVRGVPGQRYTLDWFPNAGGSPAVRGVGSTLVATLSTARPSDEHPTTGMLYVASGARHSPIRAAAIPVRARGSWSQRFNLLESTTLLAEVFPGADGVDLKVLEGEVDVVVQPYFTRQPDDFRAPKARRGAWREQLPAGLYEVILRPVSPGVASVQLGAFAGGQATALPVRPGVLEIVDLEQGGARFLALKAPPGASTGLITRILPVSPDEPLPLPLGPKDAFALPVNVLKPTRVRATGPDGEPLRLTLLAQSGTELTLQPGSWSVTVHNDADRATVAVFGAVVEPDPVPPLPAGRLTALPKFPKLTPTAPWTGDLGAGREIVLAMDLPRAGLYTLESTGLLATAGTLRSRLQLDLGSGSANGVGRNFRVASGLRSGAYQVSVRTLGASAGHLGVHLVEAPTRDGGTLEDGVTARATVPAGEGITYRFTVPEPSTWQVRSSGAARAFPCRLEDADGWPVVAPMDACALTTRLDPGTYVLRGMPAAVETRRHTTVTRARPEEPRAGHGPWPVGLGVGASHVWVEPPEGPRPTDIWTFDLPADARVTVSTGDEMTGRLVRDGAAVAELLPGRPFSGPLPRGAYRVELQGARQGTGVPYSLFVSSDVVTVGQHRTVRAPATLPVRVGTAGVVTAWSRGDADVRARLLDADGRVLIANDDRPDDWNFRLSTWLEPGDYRLELSALDGRSTSTTVTVEAPEVREGGALSASGKPQEVSLDGKTAVHELDVGRGREVVRVTASSESAMSVSLETRTPDGWTGLGTQAGTEVDLVGRRLPGAPIRVRLTSLDGRTGVARVQVDDPNPASPSEAALAQGLGDGVQVLSARSVDPGLFRVASGSASLCARPAEPCVPASSVVALDADTVLVARGASLMRAGLDRPVPVELAPEGRALGTGVDGLVALEVRSATSLPSASLAQGAVAIGEDAVLALGTGLAQLRGTGVARVRVVPLAQIRQPWDRRSRLRVEIPPGKALVVPLGPAEGALSVALERGLVARSGDAAVWADRDSVSGRIPGSKELVLANPGTTTAIAEVSPPGAAIEALGADPWEQRLAQAGTVVLQVGQGSGDAVLRASGGVLTYARADGRVLSGDALPVGPGGTATLVHPVGWVVAWVDAGRPGPWPSGRVKPVTAELPAGVHRIDVDGPFAARVKGASDERVVWRPEGGAFDVVARGPTRLEVRGLDGRDPLVVPAPQPVVELQEGVGPEVLLDAGGSRWFRFQVGQDGPIGFGVRAGADRVTASVRAPDGTEMASGVVGRVELTAGTWWLVLTQDPGAPPVRVRPALAGVSPPDTGPPEDVVKQYLTAAGGAR